MRRNQARLRLAAAWTATAVLHAWAAWCTPFGTFTDETLYVLLGRALLRGAFALPDWMRLPVTEPLPGWPLVLSPAVWLLGSHWALYRLPGLSASALAVWLTWRLARRALPGSWAAACALLTALNPAFVNYASSLLPDIPFLALALALLDASAASPASIGALAAGAALAALLRPHGALLALGLACAVGLRAGFRRAAGFLILSLIPLSAWAARNARLAGTATAYLALWRAQAGAVSDPAAPLRHAGRLAAAIFGRGILGLPSANFHFLAVSGSAILALAIYGAVRSLREGREPWLAAMAAYAALVLAVHLTWGFAPSRYALLLLPSAWIFALSGARRLLEDRAPRLSHAPAAVLALALCGPVLSDLSLARALRPQGASVMPGTMAWIRDRVPPGAHIQCLAPSVVMLLADRPAQVPPRDALDRAAWLSESAADGFDHVLVVNGKLSAGGFYDAALVRYQTRLEGWARAGPELEEIFRDDGEGTVLFRIRGAGSGR